MADRPNFIIVMTDQQQGYQLGCTGHPDVKTPHIDALARDGVLFERAYTPNPVCMPSRNCLMTGQTVRGHMVRQNGSRPRTDIPTIPGILRNAGYRTHAVGKIHLEPCNLPGGMSAGDAEPADWPESHELWNAGRIEKLPLPYYGFETVDFANGHGPGIYGEYLTWIRQQDPGAERLLHKESALAPPTGAWASFKCALPRELHYNRWVADRTIDYLNAAAASADPFFLWVNFPDPHFPWTPVAPYCDMYDPASVHVPDDADDPWPTAPASLAGYLRNVLNPTIDKTSRGDHLREITAHAHGMVTHVDDEFGRIMKALDDTGLRSNTVVAFTSDHGELLGAHGLIAKGPYLYEELVRVPLVMSCPTRIDPGRTISSVVSMLDLPRTVLAMAGCEVPEHPWALASACEGLPDALPGRDLTPVLTGEADKVRDRAMCEFDEDYTCAEARARLRCLVTERYKLNYYAGENYGQIFDLEEDPREQRNLWDDVRARDVRADLMAQLADEIIATEPWIPRRLSAC